MPQEQRPVGTLNEGRDRGLGNTTYIAYTSLKAISLNEGRDRGLGNTSALATDLEILRDAQ